MGAGQGFGFAPFAVAVDGADSVNDEFCGKAPGGGNDGFAGGQASDLCDDDFALGEDGEAAGAVEAREKSSHCLVAPSQCLAAAVQRCGSTGILRLRISIRWGESRCCAQDDRGGWVPGQSGTRRTAKFDECATRHTHYPLLFVLSVAHDMSG